MPRPRVAKKDHIQFICVSLYPRQLKWLNHAARLQKLSRSKTLQVMLWAEMGEAPPTKEPTP